MNLRLLRGADTCLVVNSSLLQNTFCQALPQLLRASPGLWVSLSASDLFGCMRASLALLVCKGAECLLIWAISGLFLSLLTSIAVGLFEPWEVRCRQSCLRNERGSLAILANFSPLCGTSSNSESRTFSMESVNLGLIHLR